MQKPQLDHIIGQVLDYIPATPDIFFTSEKSVQAELDGQLHNIPLEPNIGKLLPFQVEAIAFALMGNRQRLYQELAQKGACDLSYELYGRARFRVNIFRQRGSYAIVMRQLSSRIPDFKTLGLPPVFEEMVHENYGLILVTGGTGTGKTTSLAALINAINTQRAVHILTLEDPVEYIHNHKQGIVNQRELGQDFDSFAVALRHALRQSPKVILVGEIRDTKTAEIVLQAAETGHLVLGTLHTTDATQTIHRLVGMFDPGDEYLIRQRLADSLRYVVSQRLPQRVDSGLAAAFEIMRNNIRVKELILRGEHDGKTLYDIIEQSNTYGMMTFDQSLAQLYTAGTISQEMAMLYASDKARLKQRIDKINSEHGLYDAQIMGLEIDSNYVKNSGNRINR